jgi:(p)ppGpp synthase/HD superfamily hydrolase
LRLVADDGIHLGKKFFKATEWAAEQHAARGPDARPAPSLGQVLGIASMVLEDGGTEREAIAAMLLDAIGDNVPPVDELRRRFGKKVTAIVVHCVEDRPEPTTPRHEIDTNEWRDRRRQFLEELERGDDDAVLRVAAADTVREVRTLVHALRRHGSIAFARFPTPPNDQLEYYRSLLRAFTRHMARGHLTRELRLALTEMERLVELDTATAAWRVSHVDAA